MYSHLDFDVFRFERISSQLIDTSLLCCLFVILFVVSFYSSFSPFQKTLISTPCAPPLPICDPINDRLTNSSEIIGHSNGLVCIFNEPMSLLWNPATRISIQLPELDCCDNIIKCGMGWDGESDAFKVFAVLSVKNEGKLMGSIYSSETNSWKAIEEYGSFNLNSWIGEFVCGRMHWVVGSGWIETFDLKTEVFGRIELPESVDGLYPTVDMDADTGGCLRLVYREDMNLVYVIRKVWEMKKYGEDDSWASLRLPYVKQSKSTYMSWGIEKGEVKFSRCRLWSSMFLH